MVNNSYIYANQFTYNTIYKINKTSGAIIASWNMYNLFVYQLESMSEAAMFAYDWGNNVLNGIAYRPATNTWLVGGKMWDFMFEINFVD